MKNFEGICRLGFGSDFSAIEKKKKNETDSYSL
jgi:hypothetical protein